MNEKEPPVLLGVSGPLLFRAPAASNVPQSQSSFRRSTATPSSLSLKSPQLPNLTQTLQMFLTTAYGESPSWDDSPRGSICFIVSHSFPSCPWTPTREGGGGPPTPSHPSQGHKGPHHLFPSQGHKGVSSSPLGFPKHPWTFLSLVPSPPT